MAPKKSKNVNVDLLNGIFSGSITHISKNDAMPLLQNNPPLIDVNVEMIDGHGNAAVMLTEAGNKMVNVHTNGQAAAGSPYAVISDAVLPKSKRGGRGGGAPVQYPFDSLEIGQSFFVPVSAKHANPVKTLGSTVSSANLRYAEKTGEEKTVTRAKRGPKNRAVLDANGQKIMETVTIPQYRYTRKFSIRPVEAGKSYGNWVAPANGALIARVPLD